MLTGARASARAPLGCVEASETIVVSVQKAAASSAGCSGTQTYSGNSSLVCDSRCQLTGSSTSLCGTSYGVPTYCCYRPTLLWASSPNPSSTPLNTNLQAYPYFSLPVFVRMRLWNPKERQRTA